MIPAGVGRLVSLTFQWREAYRRCPPEGEWRLVMHYLARFLVPVLLVVLPPSSEELPRKLKPVVVWTGTDSKQAKMSFARCCSQKDWEATWHQHQSSEAKAKGQGCPEVDFDSYMIVAIFNGKSFQKTGIEIVTVTEEKNCLRVRYKPLWFQVGFIRPERGSGPAKGETKTDAYETQSYAFVVLPKSQKAIVLEEDVRNLIPDPPVWKKRATLEALPER
jgi:hypothetical protein